MLTCLTLNVKESRKGRLPMRSGVGKAAVGTELDRTQASGGIALLPEGTACTLTEGRRGLAFSG